MNALSECFTICLLTALALITPAQAAAPATQPVLNSPTPVETHGKLRVEGTRIVDEHGNSVALRGMSLFWSQWGGQFFNADCVRWLRDDWHCTVVRAPLGVGSGGYLEHPDIEQKKVEAVIDAAIKLGIYVIVDWHAHDPEPDRAAVFFSQIAKKYGNSPNIIYELWNEPLKKYDWSTVIKPYHEKLIATIRAIDPDNLIICGTQTWSQDVDKAAADPIHGTNIAYTLHFYAATHKQSLRTRAQAAIDKGIALMVTEWGTTEASGNGKIDLDETRAWTDFMDRNGLTACNWSLITKNEASAALKPGASPQGNWSADMVSTSGTLVRAGLRGEGGPAGPTTMP